MKDWIETIERKEPELFVQGMHVANDGIVITDYQKKDNPIIFINKTFEDMTGYTSKEILFKNCRFLQNKDRDQKGLEIVRQAIKTGMPCRVTLRNYKKNGSMFWNELSLAPLRNKEGLINYFIGIQKDITKQKRLEESLFSQAHEDPLTNLLNRRGFALEATQKLSLSKTQQFNILLIIIDIDHFKDINDCYGHSKGDEALIEISRLIKENQRDSDILGRYGGDEFIFLLEKKNTFSSEDWLTQLEQKIKKLNSSKKFPFSVSFSFGSALLPFSSKKTLEQAIQEADASLYRMKEKKKLKDIL